MTTLRDVPLWWLLVLRIRLRWAVLRLRLGRAAQRLVQRAIRWMEAG